MRVILMKSRPLIYVLAVAVFSLSLPQGPSEATLMPTESAIAPARDAGTDRVRVRALLDREDIQAQLEAYGISVDEARARVDSLTDDEVAVIAGQLDQLPAGGNGAAALGALVVLGLFAAVAVLVGIGAAIWHLGKWAFGQSSNASEKKAD